MSNKMTELYQAIKRLDCHGEALEAARSVHYQVCSLANADGSLLADVCLWLKDRELMPSQRIEGALKQIEYLQKERARLRAELTSEPEVQTNWQCSCEVPHSAGHYDYCPRSVEYQARITSGEIKP